MTIAQLPLADLPADTDDFVIWQDEELRQLSTIALLTRIAQGVPSPPMDPAYCAVTRTTNWGLSATGTAVPWQTSTGPMASAWSISSPTRITVPTGYTWYRSFATIRMPDTTTAGWSFSHLQQNGANAQGAPINALTKPASLISQTTHQAASGWLPCTAGDYLELLFAASPAAWQTILVNFATQWTVEFA